MWNARRKPVESLVAVAIGAMVLASAEWGCKRAPEPGHVLDEARSVNRTVA